MASSDPDRTDPDPNGGRPTDSMATRRYLGTEDKEREYLSESGEIGWTDRGRRSPVPVSIVGGSSLAATPHLIRGHPTITCFVVESKL